MRRLASARGKPSRAPIARSPSGRERLSRLLPRLAFGAVVLFYLALRTYQFRVADSDENIYFYMAARSAFGGLAPYRDYFFAHPPLHLAFAVIALKVGAFLEGTRVMLDPAEWGDGGAALVTVKSIGLFAGAIAGICLYRALARVGGVLEAWIGGTLFLLSPDLLHSFFTGITEALMLTALGLERVTAGRDRQAGLAFAAASLVAMYAAPAGLAIWLVLLLCSRRRALTLALWTAVPLLVVHLLFLLWAGRAYWEAVFAYHLHKPKLGEGTLPQELLLMLRRSSLLVVAVPAAIVAIGRGEPGRSMIVRVREEPRVQLTALALASLAATLLFVSATRAVFHSYFVMLMLGVAPLAGLAYGALVRRAVAFARACRTPSAPLARRTLALATLALLVWPLAGEALARLPAARRTQVPDASVGNPAARTWRPSSTLGPLNDVVRALFWHDEEQLGRVYPVVTRFLWDASQSFEITGLFARYARQALPRDATIFGDPTLVSAVALQSGRRLALDEADTNFMRFKSGITPSQRFITRLRAAPPALILFSIGEYMVMDEAFHAWLERDYETSLANDASWLVYVVMRPKPPFIGPMGPMGPTPAPR
jgi:hypothetical protein